MNARPRPRNSRLTVISQDPSASHCHRSRPAAQEAGRATEDDFRDGRREGEAAGTGGEAGLQELGTCARGPQQGQSEETVVPKRRRTDREPSGEREPSATAGGSGTERLDLLFAAINAAEAQQAQVARELDQQPPEGPAQLQLTNLGGGGVMRGGGSGGLGAAGLENEDGWQLQAAAHTVLYAPNAQKLVELAMERCVEAAVKADQEVAELDKELEKAKNNAEAAVAELRQCIDSSLDKAKELLQKTMQLLAPDTPDKLQAQQGINEWVDTRAEKLKARLDVNATPDMLRRLADFDTSLAAPVQKVMEHQTALQKVAKELLAAETRKAQVDPQVEPARGVLAKLREHAGQGEDLPMVQNLALWSADLVLRVPLEELGATLQQTAEMPLGRVVDNLQKLSKLYKNLGQLKSGSLQLQNVAEQPDVFRDEVLDYSFWYMRQLAECGPMRK